MLRVVVSLQGADNFGRNKAEMTARSVFLSSYKMACETEDLSLLLAAEGVLDNMSNTP